MTEMAKVILFEWTPKVEFIKSISKAPDLMKDQEVDNTMRDNCKLQGIGYQ